MAVDTAANTRRITRIPWISEAIIIAASPVIAYALTYAYLAGYTHALEIPIGFIDVDLGKVLGVVFALIIITQCYFVPFLPFALIRPDTLRSAFLLVIPVTIGVALVWVNGLYSLLYLLAASVGYAIIWSSSRLSGQIDGLMRKVERIDYARTREVRQGIAQELDEMFDMIQAEKRRLDHLSVDIGSRLIGEIELYRLSQRDQWLIEQRKKIDESESKGESLQKKQSEVHESTERLRLGIKVFSVWILAFVLCCVAYGDGWRTAAFQTEYLVTNTNPRMVVLATSGEKLICAPFDPVTRRIEHVFRVLKLGEDKTLTLSLVQVGPLRPSPALALPPPLPPQAAPLGNAKPAKP